jgi:uncharacterized RDD family membrane protein YckC
MNKRGALGQYAGFGSRAIAFIVDILLIYLSQVIFSWLTVTILQTFNINLTACPPLNNGFTFGALACYGFSLLLVSFNLLFGLIYFSFFWILGGQTIGNYLMGVRVVRLDGHSMGIRRSIVRYIGYFISFFSLTLGFLWVLWDDRRQGWQDKLARTCVVYAWEAVPDERFLVSFNQRLDVRYGLVDQVSENTPPKD